jgi:hypothetical protein
MRHTFLLKIDAAINLILGILLLAFPLELVQALGVPFGIGLALLIECYRQSNGFIGLGLGGAIAINLCGGFVLAIWLLSGRLNLPLRAQIFLWALVLLLIGLSLIEGFAHLKVRIKK